MCLHPRLGLYKAAYAQKRKNSRILELKKGIARFKPTPEIIMVISGHYGMSWTPT